MSEDNHFITRPKLLKKHRNNDVSRFAHLNFTSIWCKLKQCLPNKTRNSAMEYKSDLKTATKVWWRFFLRYAVIFAAVNLFAGLTVNLWGHLLPKGLYTVMLLSGVLANIVATLLVIFYCLNRKFKKSQLILQGKSENINNWNMEVNSKFHLRLMPKNEQSCRKNQF